MNNIALLMLGASAGFSSAALGIGGGVILVPGLIFILKKDIKNVLGTSLATIVPASFVGVTTHFVVNSSNLRLGVAAFTALGAIFGARAGVFLAEKINSKTLKIIFAILLIFIGVRLLGLAKTPAGTSSQILAYPFLIMLGLAAGMASSLLGIGGGVLLVPGLMILFGLGPHEAIATSLAVVFPTAIVGAIFHSKSFKINSKVLKTLIPAALAGAVLGAIATNMVPAKLLQNIFAVFMFICAVKLFLQKEKGLEES